MSNISIVVDDNAVYVDGQALAGLNLSTCAIPTGVHALQWKTNLGWIEFSETIDGSPKPANEVINALPTWANNCVNAFNAQVAANQAAAEAAAAAAKNNQPKTTGTTVV